MHHTGKKESKKEIFKKKKKWQGYEKFASRGFEPGSSESVRTIHAFNKSGGHLAFSMNDVIRGKILHVAKMATKDESSADVDFAVCSYKKDCFYFRSRGTFSFIQCLFGYVIVTLKPSC